MSTKISSGAPNLPAPSTTESASAAAQQLLEQVKSASGAAPTTPAPQAAEALLDTIERRAKTPPEYFERISGAGRTEVKELPGILPKPVLIADLLNRADSTPSHDAGISALLNRGHNEVQLTATATIGVHQLALAHQGAPTPLPDEVNDIKDNLAAHLPASASATQLVKALPNALNTAGLARLKNDASCALALKDALDNPAMLRATLAGALDKCPAFRALNNEDKALVLDAANKNIEARFTSAVNGLIKHNMQAQLDTALTSIKAVNATQQTRQAFLQQLARGASPEVISRALQTLGLPEEDAATMASSLFKHKTEPLSQRELTKLDDQLKSHLSDNTKSIGDLKTMISNDNFKGDMLQKPLYATAREHVYKTLDIKLPANGQLPPRVSGAEAAIAGAITQREATTASEQRAIFWVGVGTALATGGLSAGVMGAIVTGAAGQAPGIAISASNVDTMSIAERLKLVGEGSTDRARRELDVDIAISVASIALDVGGELVKSALKPAAVEAIQEIHNVKATDYLIDAGIKPKINDSVGSTVKPAINDHLKSRESSK